jgi:archaetidylinositol phosphate synthase
MSGGYLLLTIGQQGARRMTIAPTESASSAAAAPRAKNFVLARPEARVLEWIARRLPARVMPDHLTALGVAAAAAIAAAYALSAHSNTWLWVASGLLVVHWLGDSLDGTLARVRRSERPRYGYYLDHLVDALATALIGIGLGLSPHLLLATGLLVVIAYLVLSINTYLETQALGVFSLGYGRVGPTEARLALIGLNTAMALGAPLSFTLLGVGVSVLDVVALAVVALMLGGLVVRAVRNLRALAVLEPAQTAL